MSQQNALIQGLATLAGAAAGGPVGAGFASALATGLTEGFDNKDRMIEAGIGGFAAMLTGGTAGVAFNALAGGAGGGGGMNGLMGLVANSPRDQRVLSGAISGGLAGGAQGAAAGAMNQMFTGQMSPGNIFAPAGNVAGINDRNGVPYADVLGGLLAGGLREVLYSQQRVRDEQTMSPLQQQQFATGERRPDYKGTAAPDNRYLAAGGYIEGPGTGTSDSIPAAIYQDGGRVQEARLSDGEFVMTEDAVLGAGNGNAAQGAQRMYQMMDQLEGAA